MKRTIVTLYMLSAVGAAMAQARFSANTENYSFGQIEWKHPVTANFVVTNTGDRPLVMSDVEPDCACTAVQWTQDPIAPGEKGTLSVTFDAEALGHFQKSVTIFTNAATHPIYLKISGEVVREIKDFSKTHPYEIGGIRLDRNEIEFPDVQRGERPVLQVGVANMSGQPYEPVLMHMPFYVEMKSEPQVLQQGEKGVITLTLNTDRLTDFGLTQSSVYLSRFTGDKVGEENELPLSAVLLPDFSGLTENERLNAPAVSLSMKDVDMSVALAKKNKARQDIILTNTGRSPLQINKLQVFHRAVGVSLKKSVLQPGESTRLRVTVDKRNITKQRRHLRLLMITNDPKQPKMVVNIKL
ncbi:MAG: DUF1573 domain-containing protein [Bacteroides sp.]|nr:DUF1573 domain-containing protein [Bacteroides sp.]